LRIAEGCDGRTLIRCFAGCDVADILAAAGLRLSDLFTTPASGKPRDEIPEDIAAALAALPKRLTKRERVLAATIITCNTKTLDAAIARGLALATEGEIVQLVLREER
jgi:hypothetical protein